LVYILIIVISAVLTDNFILSKFLGICPFLGVSKRMNTALGMSAAVIFVMTLASAVTWPINRYILQPDFEYMTTVVFILVIATLVQFIEIVLKKLSPGLYSGLGIYLPLITTNCAVLGVTLLNIGNAALLNLERPYTFLEALVNGFGSGLGFMLALVIFTGVRSKLETSDIPEFLKGLPITLISASIVSVSFFGFQGIARGLFG